VSPRCLICLGDLDAGTEYHVTCLDELFGAYVKPAIDVEVARLHTVGLAMVGRTSLSGVQRKVSLSLEGDRMTLRLAVARGQYILKPQAGVFPELPENEHVSLRIARRVGLDVPPSGLLRLKDGTLAFIVRRFDRRADGSKRLQEDFCQLAQRSPKDKYRGSAELCARVIKRYADEPIVEAAKLFRLMVFGWWIGDGDAHLKNFSLLRGDDGRYRLSPVYDRLSTRLVIPDDRLALPVGGRDEGLTAAGWREYATYCGLPERAARRVVGEIVSAAPGARDLVARSFLSPELREAYGALLTERAEVLAGF